MQTDPKLERYLNNLEMALKPFSVTDRADIIIEIRSHVLEALARDPQTNVDAILSALGAPETVANKYLLERGLKTAKPPISPIVKWLVIGFLGTVALMLAGTIALFTHLSPVVKVNEKAESVSLFGGAIQIDGAKLDPNQSGSTGVATGQAIEVKFSKGNFEINSSESSNFTWECSGLKDRSLKPETLDQTLTFDLSKVTGVNCELGVPKDAHMKIIGSDGNVDVLEPKFHVDAEISNGNITFENDEDSHYKFDVKVENGNAEAFTSSENTESYLIKLTVHNGNIEN